jgi:predicted NUDIX family NTP pyrophosphohydrolase
VKSSAGILLYKFVEQKVHFFLLHPGGPFWKSKDLGAWTIPKGEVNEGDKKFDTALREYKEETGSSISGNFIELSPIRQKGGKLIYAWAVEGNIISENIKSNLFPMEWPPKSGKWIQVPEIDKGEWFVLEMAKAKINPAQISLITELLTLL